jgi:hypothetical protein
MLLAPDHQAMKGVTCACDLRTKCGLSAVLPHSPYRPATARLTHPLACKVAICSSPKPQPCYPHLYRFTSPTTPPSVLSADQLSAFPLLLLLSLKVRSYQQLALAFLVCLAHIRRKKKGFVTLMLTARPTRLKKRTVLSSQEVAGLYK